MRYSTLGYLCYVLNKQCSLTSKVQSELLKNINSERYEQKTLGILDCWYCPVFIFLRWLCTSKADTNSTVTTLEAGSITVLHSTTSIYSFRALRKWRLFNEHAVVHSYTTFQNTTKTPFGDKGNVLCRRLHGVTLGLTER